jgi:hypothetical protein
MPFGEADVYGGASLGVMFVFGSAPASGGDSQSFFSLALYKALYAGMSYPLGPGAINAEVRWSSVRFDAQNPRVQVVGNMGGPTALVGYQVEF